MSQLTSVGTERDQKLDLAIPNENGVHEAEHQNEAISDDANTSDATSLKLAALKSYIGAAQQHQNYVSDWLYRGSGSDFSPTSGSVSPKTVVGASPAGSLINGRRSPGGQSDRRTTGRSSPGLYGATSSEFSTLSVPVRALRPRSRSRSRSRTNLTSTRSPRPRSPSPSRRHSVAVVAEKKITPVADQEPCSPDANEVISPVIKRPLRPRSPSPERVASPPDGPAQTSGGYQKSGPLSPGRVESSKWEAQTHLEQRNADTGHYLECRSEQAAETGSLADHRSLRRQRDSKALEAPNEVVTQSRPLFGEQTSPSGDPIFPAEYLLSSCHHRRPDDRSLEGDFEPNETESLSPRQPPVPFAPMPPPPSTFLPPPPMMPAVFNIAHSLAGARPRRRFSEPSKPPILRSSATQVDASIDTNASRPSYRDSATQTSGIRDASVKDPRASGLSMTSITSSASKGTQTTDPSSLPFSNTSSDCSSPLRQQHTSSIFTTQKDAESDTFNDNLRQSLSLAKSEPPPKKPPPTAKSTRISRILVNSEALSFMHVPHEVQDDYIVVHRIVRREEIMELAELTIEIREARAKGKQACERMWEQWRAERYKSD